MIKIDTNAKDITILCKNCGEGFIFPANITVDELSKNIGEENAKELLFQRDSLLKKLNTSSNILSKQELEQIQTDFIRIEDTIVRYSGGNSQEAYNFRGYENEPAICPNCKEKRHEERKNRSRR